jgi:glycosyltransferase involved in cell wall biosynthesis
MTSPLRLAYLVSHPIQYQAPLLRRIAATPGIELTVFFMSDHGVKPTFDRELGKAIQFDVPLLEGYEHVFLHNRALHPEVGTFSGGIHPELIARLARGHFDALWVHGYSQATTWLGFAAASALRLPVMLRGESTLLYERELSGLKWLAKRAVVGTLTRRSAALLYIGDQNKRFYLQYGARPEQLFFAPYSVENDYFAERAAQARLDGTREALRARLSAKPDDVVLLFVGKLVERKRPLDLVQALKQLGPRAVGAFIGDGELRGVVEKAIAREGVRATVVGFANQSELPSWSAASDLFVLPSMHETWGLVTNEAMAAGLPAVVSDLVGCGPDLIAGEGSGAIFRCREVPALVQALRPYVDDASVRSAASAAALRVVRRYDTGVTADGVVQAIRMVAKR